MWAKRQGHLGDRLRQHGGEEGEAFFDGDQISQRLEHAQHALDVRPGEVMYRDDLLWHARKNDKRLTAGAAEARLARSDDS